MLTDSEVTGCQIWQSKNAGINRLETTIFALKCRFSGGSDRIDFLASTAPQFLVPDKCLTPFSKALNSLYLNLKDKGP